jgi:hypothetical protein
LKADLELTKLDYDGAQRAIKQAIDFDYQWWSPHNRIGMLLLERAQWNAAEKEFLEAQTACIRLFGVPIAEQNAETHRDLKDYVYFVAGNLTPKSGVGISSAEPMA